MLLRNGKSRRSQSRVYACENISLCRVSGVCSCAINSSLCFSVENVRPQNAQTVSELPKELMDNELLPKYKRDLVAKLKCLRAELNALQPQSGHCRLEVSRNEIFEVRNRSIYMCASLF